MTDTIAAYYKRIEDQKTLHAQHTAKFAKYMGVTARLVVPSRDRIYMLRKKVTHRADECYMNAIEHLLGHRTYIIFTQRTLSEIECCMDATFVSLVEDHAMYLAHAHVCTMNCWVVDMDTVAFQVC